MTAPETIYLDGDASTDEGVYPRCFNDPKPASEPVNVYHHESICIRRDDPALRQVMDAVCFLLTDVDEDFASAIIGRKALAAIQELIGETK